MHAIPKIVQSPWAKVSCCMFLWLLLFCLSSCNESKSPCFDHILYFDSQGDKTDAYVEGGIQIEYNKNDLTKFAVSSSTLTTYTHLLYSVRNHTISGVDVTIKSFIDSAGNISYDSPAEVKTQTIDFESSESHNSNYRKIGYDALKAIIQSATANN